MHSQYRFKIDQFEQVFIKNAVSFRASPKSLTGWALEFKYIEEQSKLQHPDFTTSLSHDDENRYTNVHANENTLVLLKNQYINANWINDRLIITQAPLSNTVYHFWDMIFNYNVKQIVMLTELVENNTEKCYLYYPLDNQIIVDDINITLNNVQCHHDIVQRRFCITKDNQSKCVYHYQFSGWSDFGLPSIESFCHLITLLNDHLITCIHCSAGLGRSGVFSVVSTIYHDIMINNSNDINIVDSILKMRLCRSGLVQTTNQLEFCYKALYFLLQKNDCVKIN
ncbi:MAG TPA: protein-tyrosine phosphatase family protein [Candidatus Saccharimonadales bacterium]|nr:protein-tyrosine phosphatase family protein [Candidatus Saccharimonadales bacterium]